MKKIISLILCLAMLLGLCALFGCKKDKGDEISFDKIISNLESHDYTVSSYGSYQCGMLEDKIYSEFGLEVTVKRAFEAYLAYCDYYVSAIEFSSSSEAKSVMENAEKFGYATVKGSILIMASTEEATNHALKAYKSSDKNTNTNVSFDKMSSNLRNRGYSITIASSSECQEAEESAYDEFGVRITVKNMLTAYLNNSRIILVEFSSSSEARTMKAQMDQDVPYSVINGSILIMANDAETANHALIASK